MQFQQDMRVTMQRQVNGDSSDGYSTVRFNEGDEVIITRVGTLRMLVRGVNRLDYHEPQASMWVPIDAITPPDPNAPRPRKLGEVPEGMIDPRDPGLKWLWEDAAAYAKKMGYCGTYDEIVRHLGIPGRPKNYTASIKVGKIEMSGKYLCQSKDEARELLLAELKESGVLVPEGTAASVVES